MKKRKRRGVLLIVLACVWALALVACDSGNNAANPAFNGTFRGTTSDGDTVTTVLTVGSPLTGTFETGSGGSGTIDGTATGNEATFTATFNCQAGSSGQANGTATLSDDNTMSLTLSGTDCQGAAVDVTGTLSREADAFGAANRVRGGLLYDKWWAVNGATEPTDTNPTYPTDINPAGRTGSQTWRCKECHGWDYKGKDGAYGEGSSHFTGIAGILETSTATTSSAGASLGAVRAMSAQDLFNVIRNGVTGTTGTMTGYSTAQLSDADIWDLVRFIKDGLIDVTTYVDPTTEDAISPDTTNGMTKYDAVCAACHGVYGALLKFGGGTEVIGDVAGDNPWEFFHKVRFGQPGSSPTMPSGIESAWTSGDVRDVLGYTQDFSTFAELNSVKRGALLYDKWWAVNGATEPTDTNPTYPTDINPAGRTGSQTWRCKECHGWDYQGRDGAYASGSSHFTDIAGILSASSGATTSAARGSSGTTRGLTDQQLFDVIRNGTTGTTGTMTGYTQDQLSDQDINDLVMFIQLGLEQHGLPVLTNFIDLTTGEPIDANVSNGQTKYEAVCAACHGTDGKTIVIDENKALGDLADENPWEFFHKASFGQPGTDPPMLGAIDQGWAFTDVRDIVAYARTLPLFSETGGGGGGGGGGATGDATAGLAKYDSTCAVCHMLGTHDTTSILGAPDLSGKGELVVNDLGTINAVMNGITLTDQEVLDVAAALEAN